MKSTASYIISLIVGMVIFLGLPLLGWGLGHVPQFFAHPARLTYAVVILALQVFSLIYNPQVGRNNTNTKSGVERRRFDLILIQILSLAVVIAAPFSDGHSFGVLSLGDAFRFAGFILLVPGFILMQMSEKFLDKQFSIEVTIQKDHKLIQSGPYRYIRHPRYLGILGFFAGISLVFRSGFSLLLVLGLAAVLVWRVYAEEALMHQEFGADWEAYCKRSWRIIPFVF